MAGAAGSNGGPAKAARQAWSQALSQVADAWNRLASGYQTGGQDPPWLDDAVDESAQRQIGEANRAGDLPKALSAIDDWRQGWLDLLKEPRRTSGLLAGAEAIIAESEGRAAPRNPGVHRMFAEANERFGQRDQEDDSLTAWIRRNAPEVAAQWPEAPVNASWFDWRRRVGPEHVEVLDRAWKEVTRQLGERGAN